MKYGDLEKIDTVTSTEFLLGKSEFEEVFDDLTAFRMSLVKQLGMKLDAVETPALLLHRLDLARLVRSSLPEPVRQFLHFVTVVVPDSDLGRQSLEETFASVLDRQETTLTLCAVVAFARFESSHQSDFSTISDRDLLVTTTNPEDRLARVFDDFKNSGE